MALCGVDPSLLLFLKELGVQNVKFAYGLIFTGTGIGLTISAFFAPKIIKALTPSKTYSIAVFGYCPMFFVTYFYPHPVLIFLVFFVVGFSSGVMSVITMGFRQKLFDSAVQGRVTTVLRWVLWGSIPFGQFFGGYLAEWYGFRSVYLIFGCAMFCAFLVWMSSANKKEVNAI
jgi:MFS family permease